MASLAGVPPLVGFWAKLAVLRAAVEGGRCGWRSSAWCSP
jgi:NADH:ubiquinone oxidoreductase subunit 2 (subunit N)